MNPDETAPVLTTPETQTPEYIETLKYTRWVKFYTDPNEKDTFGNKTQSSIKAYDLDPVTQYHSAATMGWENFKKLEHLASDYLEGKGLSFFKLMDYAASQMYTAEKEGTRVQWWDRIMEMTGNKPKTADEEAAKTVNNTLINNYHINSPEVGDFNSKFLKFVEAQEVEEKA